jgi:peptidoglycan/xylan/chitin deacetylase (PgdA/CDA1 family)
MGKKIACITLDIEPDLRDPQRRVRLFDDNSLRSRYEAVVRANDLKVTGFVVTSLIESYGQAIDRLSQHIPVEFGVHSHDHDTKNPCSREQIEKASRAYEAFWGTAPLGYRAPIGLMSRDGVKHLLHCQYQYDTSIYPSIRLDEYHYSHLSLPLEPFRFVRGHETLVELPAACLRAIRLVFSFSHVKLLSLRLYRMLMVLFPLPDVVVLGSHPYDFYVSLIAHHLKGWKRLAHLRNARRAFDLFEQTVKLLRGRGYEFMYMSELNDHVRRLPHVPRIPVDGEW